MPLKLLRASLRNYRRVLLLSMGVILAVSLFAGINIGVEAISRGVLESYVQSVPYDMTYNQQDINASFLQINQQISTVTDVAYVETVLSWNLYQANLSSTTVKDFQRQQIVLTGLNSDFASKHNVTLTQGNWNLAEGVILSEDLSLSLKVKPGDFVNLSIAYYNATSTYTNYWNTTFRVAGVAAYSQMAASLISGVPYISGPFFDTPSLGTIQSPVIAIDYNSLLSAFHAYSEEAAKGSNYYYPSNPQIYHRIFLDRDAVINLFDADSTLNRLTDIENRIRIKLVGICYYGCLDDHLAAAINSYRFWLQTSLIGFYFFSLPVLPISWYLAMTSWYMVTSRRRREFGLLKVRGISSRSIFRTALLESVVIGIVGSILGVFVGYGVGAVVATLFGSPPSFVIGLGALTPELLEVSLGLGAFISILAAIRPARLAARMEPTEAVKEYQGEEVEVGKPWRPTWTWAAVALGTYKMLEWIFNFSPTTLFPYGPPGGGNFFIAILYFVWIALSGILIALGPFLFVYGVTKLVTRSQNRLYRSTVLILRFLVKDLANVTARALSRNPARVSRVAFLIALTLTFGIFVNVVMASTWDLQVRTARLQIGADMNVQAWMSGVNETFASNLTAVPGVSQVSPIFSSYAQTPYSGASSVTLYGIDPENYLDVALTDEEFTLGPPEPLFQKMRTTPDAILLSEGLANFLNVKVDDTFQVNQQAANGSYLFVVFTVAGFFRVLPGVGSVEYGAPSPGGFFSGGAVLASLPYIRSVGLTGFSPGSFTFLCKLDPNMDAEQVATTVRTLYAGATNVQTIQERMQGLTENPAQIAIFRFLQLTSAYLFVAAVLGFALISWANTRDRLGEIAIFRSRGTSRRQALQILFAESFSILLLAMIIGAATGIISSYGVLTFFTSLSGSVFSGLGLRLVATVELWLMLTVSVAGFLLSILISAWLSLRKTVIETVRFR